MHARTMRRCGKLPARRPLWRFSFRGGILSLDPARVRAGNLALMLVGYRMSKPKKALVIYLVASSVILHCLLIYAIITFGPAMKAGYEMGEGFARASAGQAGNLGTIKDVSTLQEGEHSYVGYAVDYKGQTLYLMGSGAEGVKVGDQVAVTISKHPYGPLKTLMVMVTKNGP
jgi:hypothetical protein